LDRSSHENCFALTMWTALFWFQSFFISFSYASCLHSLIILIVLPQL
jgi:hypothetical protein